MLGKTKRKTWQLQDAKARFSELFRLVRSAGPQWVTRQGKEAVVILPAEKYEDLCHRKTGPKSLVQFFARSPLAGSGIDLTRDRDPGRDVKL
ncbi:MAG: hypothetical protein A3A86_02525 [Elusimicrobia bacterium RIFCSPLOWO2_01_FULL_60_11]|nr:MAG: hypothetical protein A3A86_02525 [Elusimicrobia bacterium RIFCSPLOWO2_01_FULL_60_11]